jgi:hypothetical protein
LQDYNTEELKLVPCIWEIGVSERACSVAEDGVLRAIEFTIDLKKPTVSHIIATLKKAIAEPIEEEMEKQKPEFVVFLDTVVLSSEQQKFIKNELKEKLNVTISTMEKLHSERPELFDIKKSIPVPTIPQFQTDEKEIPFNEKPPRGCFNCRSDIVGKASQCSACKAVIYCSADCAVF